MIEKCTEEINKEKELHKYKEKYFVKILDKVMIMEDIIESLLFLFKYKI